MENQAGTERKEDQAAQAPASKRSFWARPMVILIGCLLLGGLFFIGFRYMVRSFTHESTDDAFLDGQIVSIAPKIAGQITQVHVRHNQRVKAGDLLVEIDPRDFEVALEQKKSVVASAQANVELLRASLALLRAQVEAAEATARQTASEARASQATAGKSQADLKRAEDLFREKTISPQEYDSAKAIADTAAANLRAAQDKAAGDQSK